MSAKNAEEKRSLEVAEEAKGKGMEKTELRPGSVHGAPAHDLLFPFPEQDPEDKKAGDEVLDKVKAFLVEKVDADRIDREREIPPEVMDGLKELGLFGIKIPKEYGGWASPRSTTTGSSSWSPATAPPPPLPSPPTRASASPSR